MINKDQEPHSERRIPNSEFPLPHSEVAPMILKDQEENPAKGSVVCGKGSHWGTLPPGTDVQNIPALTRATLSGPAAGLVGTKNGPFTVALNTAASTSVTVNLASNNGSDTFQATQGGGNVTSITIPAGSTTVTFYLTPGGTAGNRSISITTSPSLTYSGSPITYSAAAVPTSATLSGPTSGIVGVESTAFTVTVNQPASTGGVTVTPASSIGSDTFQGTLGGRNVCNVSEINFGTQGGTPSSPALTTLWTFQPVDTTKGPWQLVVSDMLFGTTHDSVCSWGYNVGSNLGAVLSSEPTWRYSQEQDYYIASLNNTYTCEAYQEFISAGGAIHTRPWACTLNRATGAVDIAMDIGPSGDPHYGQFTITSTPSVQLLEVVGGDSAITQVILSQSNVNRLSLGAAATNASANIGIGADGYLNLGGRSKAAYVTWASAFQLYKLAGDPHLYLYDLVNTRQIITITPAADTSTVAISGNATITGASDAVQLVVEANSTQTHHLQEWQNSSGGVLAYLASNGNFTTSIGNGVAISAYTLATNTISYALLGESTGINSAANVGVYGLATGSSSQNLGGFFVSGTKSADYAVYTTGKAIILGNMDGVQFAVRANSTQTKNLQQWQNSSGTPLAYITAAGTLVAPQAGPLSAKTGAYTAAVTDRIILASAASVGWALTLPAANSVPAGWELLVKKTDNNSNAITITPNGSNTIEGAATYALYAQYKYIRLIFDGTGIWYNTGSN